MIAWLLLSLDAHALCGAYLGDGEGLVENHASHVVVARQGNFTTLSMFNDFKSELATFGMVMPIPAGVDADHVGLAGWDLLESVALQSEPRTVHETCKSWYDLEDPPPAPRSGGCASDDTPSRGCGVGGVGARFHGDDSDFDSYTSDGVAILDEFQLAEYTGWVVSAEGASELESWLAGQGFVTSESTAAVLQSYIDAGSNFLALKVDTSRVEGAWLSPLQLAYTTLSWDLPIRLGATSSAGVQELMIYSLTDYRTVGRTTVTSYPETAPPASDCILPEGVELEEWYEAAFTAATGLPAEPEALAGEEGFAWVTEFAGSHPPCADCDQEEEALTDDEVFRLGFAPWDGWTLTRIHLRFTPGAVAEDLSFAAAYAADYQLSYVDNNWEILGEMPLCEDGASDGPACYSADWWLAASMEGHTVPDPVDDGCHCGHSQAVVLLPLLLWFRRRR